MCERGVRNQMASRNFKLALLGASTLFLYFYIKKLRDLRKRKRKLLKAKQKLRRKTKPDRPVRVQKSTLELYDSDSEAQRAKRPRLDEEEVEKSEDDESIESIESSSENDSSDESCYSSLISNSESDSTHSESFISDTEDEFEDDDVVDDIVDDYETSNEQLVKPEIFDDPLATINYDDEDRKPDLDELAEALRKANKDDTPEIVNNSDDLNSNYSNPPPTSIVRIKEEPRFF